MDLELTIKNEEMLSIEEKKDIKPVASKPSANINTSQTNEVNPYLLLMAHSIIKHVIDIDNNTSLGLTSHADWGRDILREITYQLIHS